MRYQPRSPRPHPTLRERPNHKDHITRAERVLLRTLIKSASILKWEKWIHTETDGFRTITPDNHEITFRLYQGCLYGNGSCLWQYFGVRPTQSGHWYYIIIRDPEGRSRRKMVLNYAAPPSDKGYKLCKELHESIINQKLENREPFPENFAKLARKAIFSSPNLSPRLAALG